MALRPPRFPVRKADWKTRPPARWLALASGFLFAAGPACTGTLGEGAEQEDLGDEGPGPSGPGGARGTKPGTSSGSSSGPGTGATTPPPPANAGTCATARTLGPAPLRRLTHEEYAATVRDLLGLETRLELGFPKEGEVWGLTNNVDQQTLSGALLERYHAAAEKLSGLAFPNVGRLSGCDVAVKGETACAEALVDALGPRAYRRPLEVEERQSLMKVFTASRADADWKAGARGVIEALLIAPQFLFRVEALPPPGTIAALDPWAVASRLSYLLWGTMPDEALFTAAREGRLKTPPEIAAQAERLLADPRAKEIIRRVHGEWLDFDRVGELRKDAKKFPEFSPALAASMRGELERFVDHVWDQHGGSVEALFTSATSFLDAPLAKLYGATGVTGTAFSQVELDPTRRAGILTRAGLLSSISGESDTGLVHRGLFVRERLLCQPVPPPPADQDTTLPPVVPGQTTRERFARHQADPTCASCHKLTDGIGLALETYDAIGRWRPDENGQAIDATGELAGAEGGGKFDGAAALGRMLGKSPTVHACAATVWFRYAFGRTETAQDACTLGELGKALAAENGRTRAFLVRLVQNDAFRLRAALP